MKRQPANDPLIVAIGTSGGNRDCLNELLSGLCDKQTSLDDVIVVCLLDEHCEFSDTACNLMSATGLTLTPVEAPCRLEVGRLYLIPARSRVVIERYFLSIDETRTASDSGQAQAAPIDELFITLARNHAARSAGVLLSGRGSDGQFGLQALRDAGAMTFAHAKQVVPDAQSSSEAAVTIRADHLMSPRKIGEELVAQISHHHVVSEPTQQQRLISAVETAIPVIADRLLHVTGQDFRHYKYSTVGRRIRKRMQVLKLALVDDYVDVLTGSVDETKALFQDLLIGVTAFFRNPETFALLEKLIVPALFANRKPDEPVRIWVPGCASGQEAYSLAILCLEYMTGLESAPELKIFATDIDEQALHIARAGIYPERIREQMSSARLKAFFVPREQYYQVSRQLRESVIFSRHNLISDPPFARQDLVSCRNLLIYLDSHLHKQLIPQFHYAMKPSGFLLLGSSESLTSHQDLFEMVDARHRIAQRLNPVAGVTDADEVGAAIFRTIPSSIPSVGEESAVSSCANDLQQSMNGILMTDFAPGSVVINQDNQVVSISADMHKYLVLQAGRLESNLVKIARKELRIGLRAAIKEFRAGAGRVILENLQVLVDGKTQSVMLTVQTMPDTDGARELAMVTFQDIGLPIEQAHEKGQASSARKDTIPKQLADANAIIEQLKRELADTRDELEKSLQDMEVGNDALARAKNDLENLLLSTNIATIFLDDAYCIRRFTPAARDIYGLIPSDIGRPLLQLMPRVEYMPEMPSVADVHEGVDNAVTITTHEGKAYVRHVTPYRTHDGSHDGLVVTYSEVTQLQESEEMLRRSLIAAKMDAFHLNLVSGQMLRQGALFDQPGVSRLLDHDEYLARVDPDDRRGLQRVIDECTPDRPQYRYTYRFTMVDGQVRWLAEEGKVQFDGAAEQVALSGTCRDVTDARQRELLLLERERDAIYREEQLRRVIDHQLGLVGIVDLNGILLEVDNTSMSIAGTTRGEVIGKHFADTCFWNYDKAVSQRIREAMEKAFEGKVVRFDVPLGSADGKTLMIDFMLAPLYDEQGAVEFLIPSGVDISERKQAEQALLASENRLRVGVAVANLALAELDYSSDTAHMSKEALQLYGLDESISAITLEQLYAFIHDEDRDWVLALIDRQLASPDGDAIHCQHRLLLSDGSLRWVEVRMQFFFDTRQVYRQPHKGILAARDITEQKSIEGRLQESETRFRSMVDDLPNLIWVHDDAGELQTVNRTFLDFFGLDDSGAIKGSWRELIHPDDLDEYVRDFQTCVQERRVFRAQVRAMNAEGKWRWLESVGLPRVSDAGEFLGFAGSSSDVTRQHEFEDSLREARRAAEVANESKSAFIANMSHEIRTPMSAVLGYTELLSMEEKDPEKREYLNVIRRNGHFLLDIINDILDLSKVEAGKLDIENTGFAVQDVINDVLSMMKARASEKNLTFNVEYRTDIPTTIYSDPRRLQQILVNLIGNAVKFTEEGGVQLLVNYSREDCSRLHFSVVDSGIGMSSDVLARLFTPFSQGDDSVSRVFGGTGLGLAISQRLAALLGGEIVVESETGRGSCFSFTIAVGDVADQPLVSVNSDYAISMAEPSAYDITLDCRVLVVDDRKDVRVMVKRFLEKASATVHTAEDGIQAVSFIRESMEAGSPVIDLVLLDMQMPRLDGYSTARQLREMGFKAPIVALTADALQSDMSICLTSGCDAYLSKPVDSQQLLATVRHFAQELEPAELEQARRSVAVDGRGALATPAIAGSSASAESSVGKSSGLQALLVDDAADVCRSLQRLLRVKGVQAECAHDGKSALQMIDENPPDVVILDINLPDISGLELVKLMRARLELSATRFIALSGHIGKAHRQRSLEAGFDRHLEKPVDVAELLTAIKAS